MKMMSHARSIGLLGAVAFAGLTQAAAPKDTAAAPANSPGAAVYQSVCAQCHEGQVPKAPAHAFLQMMAPDAIYAALTTGVMQQTSNSLSLQQKREVAEYLTGRSIDEVKTVKQAPMCTAEAAKFDMSRPPDITAWGMDTGNTHFVPGTVAGLRSSDLSKLKLKWAFEFPGAMRVRSQPSFAMGAIYVGSQDGTVYALDEKSGCVRWSHRVNTEVRVPLAVSSFKPNDPKANPAVFFGDLVGRAYALDARTGKLLWTHKLDDHPSTTMTGAPVYHDGRVYMPVSSLEEAVSDPTYHCCSFRGSLVALDAASGKVIWKHYTFDEKPQEVGKNAAGAPILAPSGAAIWNSPTLDLKRGLIYVGTGDNYSAPTNTRSDAVLAFDLKSGQVRWSWQTMSNDAWNVGCLFHNATCPDHLGPDFDIGAGTMLVRDEQGHERLYAGTKSGAAIALDPDTHKGLLWSKRLGRGSIQGGIQFGMASDGRRLFVPISDLGKKVDPEYPGEPHPGLYALDLASGAILWSRPAANDHCEGRTECDPGILAAVSAMPGAVFAGHMDGMLRAYSAETGQTLWEYDTTREVTTVSGAVAHGGSMGGGGPLVHDATLFVASGYGAYSHMPGNVLYAFSVDGK